jgi:hypothetical protein
MEKLQSSALSTKDRSNFILVTLLNIWNSLIAADCSNGSRSMPHNQAIRYLTTKTILLLIFCIRADQFICSGHLIWGLLTVDWLLGWHGTWTMNWRLFFKTAALISLWWTSYKAKNSNVQKKLPPDYWNMEMEFLLGDHPFARLRFLLLANFRGFIKTRYQPLHDYSSILVAVAW